MLPIYYLDWMQISIGILALFTLNIPLILITLKLLSYFIKFRSKSKFAHVVLTPSTPKRSNNSRSNRYFTVGFFHPFCNSGGGGERVLWSSVKILQDTYPRCVCVIYTGDLEQTQEGFVQKAYERFKIQLDPKRTQFIKLRFRFLVLDKCYPVFTLLGQSLGSVLLGIEAFLKFIPDIYFETTGYAFTYPLFHYFAASVGSVPVCSYTHYPTISTDMLDRVNTRVNMYNNRAWIGSSKFLTSLKLYYYRLFAWMYSWSGRCANCVMTNSSWTQAHIESLWSMPYKTKIVYPPCDTSKFDAVFDDPRHDQNFYIASVGQFRPEKNHQLQIRALKLFIDRLNENKLSADKVKLKLIGSCRNAEDEQRVESLRKLAAQLGLADKVEFNLNFTFEFLLEQLAESAVGIHSMIDEHFGIGVVECMAAGTVMVAHNSAGPKMDIVVPLKGEKTGLLAESEIEYADAIYSIYNMTPKKRATIRSAAREHVKKFSQAQFDSSFLDAFNSLCLDKFFDSNKNE